ncbi:hypothetical protein CCACVL1_01864, partial [Corchorus capsularis]
KKRTGRSTTSHSKQEEQEQVDRPHHIQSKKNKNKSIDHIAFKARRTRTSRSTTSHTKQEEQEQVDRPHHIQSKKNKNKSIDHITFKSKK